MAKKQNAFYDKTAKKITKEDVEGLMKMDEEAKNRATIEANKADYKAPKYNSLPTLDDTSRKVSTKAPSVSPEQPKTMNVGNKTFKVADSARNTNIIKNNGSATAITDDNAHQLLSKSERKARDTKRATSNAERKAVNHPGLATAESVALAPFAGVEGATRTALALATGDKNFINTNGRTNSFNATQRNLREGAKSNIKSNVGKTAYDVGTGIADMLANAFVSGGSSALAGSLMGGQKAEEATRNAFERNNNTRQSALYGALSGAAEGYFNTKGLDALKGAGQSLKGIAQASAVEGAENLLQGITEDIADLIVNNKDSEAAIAYNDLVNNGVSSREALRQIATDTLKQYGVDFATGAGFGAATKGAGKILDLKKAPNAKGTDDLLALDDTSKVTSENVNIEDNGFLNDDDLNDYVNAGKHYHENRARALANGENIIIRSAKELVNKINQIVNYKGSASKLGDVGFMRVGPSIASQIKNLDGDIDTSNYFFQIVPQDLQHAFNNHRVPKRTTDLPMDENDVAFALEHINEGTVDRIEKYKDGGKRAVIIVDSPEGDYYTIQVISKKDGALALKNIWKSKKRSTDTTGDSQSSLATVHSDTSFTDNIPQNAEAVNTATELSDINKRAYQRYNDLKKSVDNRRLTQIKFDNEADNTAFQEARKDLFRSISEYSNAVEKAQTDKEILNAYQRVEESYRNLRSLGSKGYVNDKTNQAELRKLKKDFYERTKGVIINIPAEMRGEMGIKDQTMRNLNSALSTLGGNNHIKFSSSSGTPIDQIWNELVDASGNVLDSNSINSADMVSQLLEYVEGLKVDGKGVERVPAEINDYISENLFDALNQTSEEALNRIKNNGNHIMAEDIGINPATTMDEDIDIPEPNITSSMPKTVEMPDGTLKTETGEIKERGYSNSIRNKTNLPDNVKKEFPEYYEVLKNPDTEEEVNRVFASIPNTSDAVLETMRRIEQRDATAIPLGYKVSERLIAEGKHDQAVDLLKHMSEELTKSGQFTQAAAITLMHEDPMTALRYLQKQMDEINVEGAKRYKKKWHDLELTEDEIARMGELEKGDADGIKEVYNDVFKRLQKEYPSTTWEKFVELTKLGMLLNPRTHIRNTAANSLLLPVRSASDRVSAVGQLLSGAERTQSLVGGTKAQKKIAGEVYENEMKGLLEGDDKWSDLKGVARDKQVFGDSKVGWVAGEGLYRGLEGAEKLGNAISEMPLVDKLTRGKLSDALKGLAEEGKEGMTDSIIENLRRFDYYLLSKVEDDPFVKKNFTNRLASYMKAQNINNIDDIPMEAKQFAWEEALKATFKDDNKITSLLANIKKDTGKFGEVLLPFTKTPANLAARAIDYSPVGIAKAISDYYKTPLDARNVPKLWDDMSKGIVGSAGILLGYMLRKSGVITGALSDDKDTANFEKQTGKQAYSLHLGDKYYSYDWAQPAGTPMIIGANIYDAVNSEDTSEEGRLKTIGNGLYQGGKAAFDTWLQLSPLQNVGDLFNGNGNSGETTSDRFVQTITDMPQRLIPSLMGATARTVDPTMRETYDKNSLVNTWVNNAKAKIPAIGDEDNWWNTNVSSKSLPAKYDNWGNERTRSDSIKEAAFAQMVNPGQLSNNNSTPIDNEIGRLGELDAKAYPSTAGWSVKIGDNNVTLSNEQHSEYQKNLGEAQYQLAEHFVNSDYYNKFSDDEKTEILGNLYSFANALAKSEQFDYDIAGNSSYKKAYAEYQKGGLDAVADYYATKNVLSDVSEQFTKKNGEGKSFSDLSKEENLKVLTDMVNDGYMTKEEAYDYLPDNKMVETLSQYGNQGYELYADLVQHGTNDKGDFTSDNVLPVLQQTNTDPEIAGAVMYALNGNSNSHKLNDVYKNLGNQGVWDYYNYKQYADFDGNGSLKKDEIVDYLNSRNMSDDERRYWFEILKTNSKTKNPY